MYLNVNDPTLPQLREEVVQALELFGLTVDMTHGFMPHVTLRYQQPGTPHPREAAPADPFTFPTLSLWIGGNRVSFPLSGAQAFAKADTARADPRAQALLAQLGGDLTRIDAQTHTVTRRADQIRQHHQRTFETMTTHIPAVRGRALEDAALHHAGEADGAARTSAL